MFVDAIKRFLYDNGLADVGKFSDNTRFITTSLNYFHMEHQSVSSLNKYYFLFLQTYQLEFSLLRPLNIESFAILFPSFWLFLVVFRILRMLFTVNKPCHLPPASRITTGITFFTETILVCRMNGSDFGRTLSG